MDEFCIDGGILKHKEEYYKIELLNGQGTIATMEVLKSHRELKNYVELNDLLNDLQHRNYFENRESVLAKGIINDYK